MFDHFDLKGPNRHYKCLVYKLLGPNIPDTIDTRFPNRRLPRKLAKVIAKQNLYTRNLAFTMPYIDNITEEKFTKILGKLEIGYVRRSDGKDLEPSIPEYIVRPTLYRTYS
ncbi:hypothetical protein N7467_005318 [Penicillium canescens]|nr:hypothetical protein N7467_005318 [Penicillium canescens]